MLVVFLFAPGAALMAGDRAVLWIGGAAATVLRRVRRKQPPPERLPERLRVPLRHPRVKGEPARTGSSRHHPRG